MIHIYTGDGKGKTTAATGLAVRAMGAGLKVFFAQFIKDGSSSEILFLQKYAPAEQFCYYTQGAGHFIIGTPSKKDQETAQTTLQQIGEAIRSGQYAVVIADEILGSLQAGLFEMKNLQELLTIAGQYPDVEVILTGRNAPAEAIEDAGLVTEMRCIKHYFTQNRKPKHGIEW